MMISIVIPVHNEEENIIPLCKNIKKAMGRIDYEIIAIDDGSIDNTPKNIRKINDRRFKKTHLKKHMGQCFALYHGIEKSSGEIIATIDSDLQNDPSDIPKMIEELGKGYDCVCGWRYDRKDSLSKRVSSSIGNYLNNKFLRMNLHDNNCTLKVFRKECTSRIRYFPNFHRFIPVMIKFQGFRIKETKVNHSPRIHGKSKYGMHKIHNRILGNLKTMLMVKFRHKEMLEWK